MSLVIGTLHLSHISLFIGFNSSINSLYEAPHPILEFYKEKNKLYTINLLDKDEIFNEIVKIIS